jgi:hypothetical protein
VSNQVSNVASRQRNKAHKATKTTEVKRDPNQKKEYYYLYDLKHKEKTKNEDRTLTQNTSYDCKVTDDWEDYVRGLNTNFFDTNKLYIKSYQDYKTRV